MEVMTGWKYKSQRILCCSCLLYTSRKLADAADLSIDEWKELNRDLYADILPENYKNSYGNPVYACEKLGEYGKDFSFLYAELRGIVVYAFEKRLWDITVLLELFLEVYGAFAQEEVPTEEELRGILNSYANDYCQDMIEYRTRAVSYTHLDVYKRQGCGCSDW